MRTMMRATMVAAFLAALALATGCEDTPLFAGKDYKMTLVAENSTLTFLTDDPPEKELTTKIYATITNDSSVPQSGITVFFTTNVGTLDSLGQAVTTNSDGRASDMLTVRKDDPGTQITVTATSAALTKTLTITKRIAGVCDSNTPPTARIVPSATQTLPAGPKTTTHDASVVSGSTSSDGETAFTYLWDCGGGTSSSSLTNDNVTCTYTYGNTAASYTITLVVTDEGLTGHPECALPSTATTVQVNVPAGT